MKKNQGPSETLLDQFSIHAHLQMNEIKTEDGLPLDFWDHMFMFDVYTDMASLKRDIAGLKAAQVTFTTTATNAVLWIAKNRKIDIIYCLPTFDDIRVFSGGKVNRIIAQNPIYQKWVPNKDTMEQKIIGDNVIHFRGTHQPKAATMVSSDLNVMDEFDAMNQSVAEHYSTRLQHSDIKRTWWFSHPSVPDNGVDKKWKLSDQKHWFIRCPECKKYQYMNWPESFDIPGKRYMCKECTATITPDAIRNGRWIARKGKKDAKISGYWIPLWLRPTVTAAEIIDYFDTKPADYFWNKVLGLPYVGGGNSVSQQQIMQNATRNEFNIKAGRMIMGVDPGETIRYVQGNRSGLQKFGEEKSYAFVENFLEYYKNSLVIIDAGGDLIEPRRLRKQYPGRIFLCYFQRDRKTMQLVKWGEHDEYGVVTADRSRMIQFVVDEFAEKKIPLHYLESPDEWYDYWMHYSHIYRVWETNSIGVEEFAWKRNDRDDFCLATVYWKVGMMRFGGKGSIIKAGTGLKPEPNSYLVTPDMRTSVNPLQKEIEEALARSVTEKEDDWRV